MDLPGVLLASCWMSADTRSTLNCWNVNCPAKHGFCTQVLAETLGWITTAVEDFGVSMLDVRRLIDWCIAGLGSRDASVRAAVRQTLPAHPLTHCMFFQLPNYA